MGLMDSLLYFLEVADLYAELRFPHVNEPVSVA
jgi:hypothetical protein